MSTWFITGTSSGFGRSLLEQLLERGDTVAATLRRPAALDELARRHGERLWIRELDVTDAARVRATADAAVADLGRIDVVVSNAGYGSIGAAEEFTDEQIEAQLQTNVVGSIQLARAFTPHLRAQEGGRILQLSSMGGQFAYPGMSIYHASKWAVEGFYESYAQEVASFGIETCLVEPGGARTDFGGRSLVQPVAMEVYADTPVAGLREMASGRGAAQVPGDPEKIAAAMIEAAEAEVLPPRLLLGSDAYSNVRGALADRLALVDGQRELAFSTDAGDYVAPASAR